MYDAVWDRQELLFIIKHLKDRLAAFESGEKYVRMEKQHRIARDGDFRTIERLKKELAQERSSEKSLFIRKARIQRIKHSTPLARVGC